MCRGLILLRLKKNGNSNYELRVTNGSERIGMKNRIHEIFENWLDDDGEDFAGVLSVSDASGVIALRTAGLRDHAADLPCVADTSFGIASGTKVFTGLAVCKLIDEGKLDLDAKLWDILPYDLGQIDKNVTIYQLLTHTSGVGDYVDEEAEGFDALMDALYAKYPPKNWTNMGYYLQMVTPLPPKFQPGERWCYSNSGYVLLGLVIEAVSGVAYQQFVQDVIIAPCGLTHTGFYHMDDLPPNTALGYMQNEEGGNWHLNTDKIPVVGGSDGGIYSNAADIDRLWRAIFDGKILSQRMTAEFLKQHVVVDEENGVAESYGLGVYHQNDNGKQFYFALGADSGVGFFTGYFPGTKTVVSAFSNTGFHGASLLFDDLSEVLA